MNGSISLVSLVDLTYHQAISGLTSFVNSKYFGEYYLASNDPKFRSYLEFEDGSGIELYGVQDRDSKNVTKLKSLSHNLKDVLTLLEISEASIVGVGPDRLKQTFGFNQRTEGLIMLPIRVYAQHKYEPNSLKSVDMRFSLGAATTELNADWYSDNDQLDALQGDQLARIKWIDSVKKELGKCFLSILPARSQ